MATTTTRTRNRNTSHRRSRRPVPEATQTATQTSLLLVTDETTSPQRWKLDEHTREVGRKGLADARAALRAARPAHLDTAA